MKKLIDAIENGKLRGESIGCRVGSGTRMSLTESPFYKNDFLKAKQLLKSLSIKGWKGSFTQNGKRGKKPELSFGFRCSGYHNGILVEVKESFVLLTCHKRKLSKDFLKEDIILPLGVFVLDREKLTWGVPMKEEENTERYSRSLSNSEEQRLENLSEDIKQCLKTNSVRYICENR